MPGMSARRSTSAIASSTPIAGSKRGAAEPVGRVRAERRQVVVVDARHREVEVAIGGVDDPVEPVREQQFGVDAVEVERLDPRLGVVATRVDVFEAAPQTLLVGRAPGAGTPVERARRVAPGEDPRVALLEALHPRHLVAVLRGRLRGPQVGRVHEVAVGRDQPVLTRRASSSPKRYSATSPTDLYGHLGDDRVADPVRAQHRFAVLQAHDRVEPGPLELLRFHRLLDVGRRRVGVGVRVRVPHRDDLLVAPVRVERRAHEVSAADAVDARRMRGVLARVHRGDLSRGLVAVPIGKRPGEQAACFLGKAVVTVRDHRVVLRARQTQRRRPELRRHWRNVTDGRPGTVHGDEQAR